jgi:hypothetical protein
LFKQNKNETKMKKKLIALAVIFTLTFTLSKAYAQYYCFFVDNQSGVTFNELKIRPSNTDMAFSKDLLPSNMIESGKHFWVKTGSDEYQLWDVRITRVDGTPLLFTWTDTNGNTHENQTYITMDAQSLHTLVIGHDGDNLTFLNFNHDEYGYGHPCE